METIITKKSFATTLFITSLVLLIGGFVLGYILGNRVYGSDMSIGHFLYIAIFMLIGGGVGFIIAFLFIILYGRIQKAVKYDPEDIATIKEYSAILNELKAILLGLKQEKENMEEQPK